jgi:hypothetical protein
MPPIYIEQVENIRDGWVKDARRLMRWAIGCAAMAFAVAMMALTPRGLVFFFISAFFGFACWNRLKERQRLQRLIEIPVPQTEQEASGWASSVNSEFANPLWERISSWVVGAVIASMLLLQYWVVMATAGFWMQVFYLIIYAGMPVFIYWAREFLRSHPEIEREHQRHQLEDPNS